MLTGMDVLKALEDDQEKTETGRSQYWDHELGRFKATLDGPVAGETVLGDLSRNVGPLHTAAHWALQAPFRCMGRGFGTFMECERLGRLIARRAGRQFTLDIMRQVLTMALIRKHVDLSDPKECNLVIGDGLGVMASLMLLATPERKTIVVNLTKSLLLDLVFARLAVPKATFALVTDDKTMGEAIADPSVGLIAVQADNARIISVAAVGLAVNIVSMQEMMPAVVAGYFEILRSTKAPRTAFYCCNKLSKRVGRTAVSNFMDYPWRDDDEVLVDEVCPWSQWQYSKRPPFWHYRRGHGRIIWHRLVRLSD